MKPRFVGILAIAVAATGWQLDSAEVEQIRRFETDIRPLLIRHCSECHDPKEREGGFVVTTVAGLRSGGESGPVLVPGNAGASRLIQAVRYTGRLKMPPEGKLPPRTIARLEAWVSQGAALPGADVATALPEEMGGSGAEAVPDEGPHWSLQPIDDPGLPAVADSTSARNGIDHFILAKLESEGLSPNRPASRRTLIRRVSYDLTGRPPEPTRPATKPPSVCRITRPQSLTLPSPGASAAARLFARSCVARFARFSA